MLILRDVISDWVEDHNAAPIRAQRHHCSEVDPRLELAAKPRGRYGWDPRHEVAEDLAAEDLAAEDLAAEGPAEG